MSEPTLESVDELKQRLQVLDSAGPRLPDATSRAAYAYRYTCEALKKHYPFHVLGIRSLLKELDGELDATLARVGEASTKPESLLVPRASKEVAAAGGLAHLLTQPVPVVVSGGAADCAAVAKWSPGFFAEHYGSYELPLAKASIQDSRGTIAQVVADIESKEERGHYVHNVANFFNEHRELEDQLPIAEYLKYVAPADHFGCQLFLGGPKTGTSWHNASGWNFFFNVYGNKRWFFAHPQVSPWMYGRLHPSGSVGLTDLSHNLPASEQLDKYPLYQHVPVFTVLLDPGDVLVVPPWWWHAVTNESDATIGVSTRWLNPRAAGTMPEFRVAQGLMPSFQEFEREAGETENFRIRDKYVRDTYDNAGFKSDTP